AAMGGELVDLTTADPSMAGAAGGHAMISTTSDLARFLDALLAGELFISEETLNEMLEFVDAPDDLGYPYWYGLGLEKYIIGGVTLIGHAGGAVGYSTVMYYALDHDITIVASDNVIDLGTAYLDLMMPALKELGP
ncbi:MAG: serine hydrolase, partial [Candidatus Bipolaricaulia bacterium]